MWQRWQLTQRAEIDNPTAFLVTATTRLAINVVRSARHRHEVPVEPQLADFGDRAAPDPVLSVERTVAVEGALALLMVTPDAGPAGRLRPAQGVRLRLRELAALLRISAPNARVVVHRAQARLESAREHPVPRRAAPPPRRRVQDGGPHRRPEACCGCSPPKDRCAAGPSQAA
ncbi:hypothetical protein [Streptomyces sp. KL116D]|uniref:hypothetical protein n=1 Tax=Streptomyces sp. KL116D TaxID=3045152 RepID=UPI0035564841